MTNWLDPVWGGVGGPRYEIKNDAGVVVYTAAQITQKTAFSTTPTPVNAANMNAIENKIANIREVLTAARTYYVRTNGNDANTGLANTAGGAFLTIQRAVDVVATLDINGQTVIIQVADGTYTGAVALPSVVGFKSSGNLVIQGNNGAPSNVLISTTSSSCFTCKTRTVWRLLDMKLQTTTSGECIDVDDGSVEFGNIVFGAAAVAHIGMQGASYVKAVGNYSITGGALYHYLNQGGKLSIVSRTITLTGTPVFSITAFCDGSGSSMDLRYDTYTGLATGSRYLSQANGSINTAGGGASYIPGNSGGSTASGGQYL